MPVDSFDWLRWRNCDIFNIFNFSCRFCDIISNKKLFKKYAVGYIKGEKLSCRMKPNTYAVMLLVNNDYQWFHMTSKEFLYIFNERM